MKRAASTPIIAALLAAACSPTMGAPREIQLPALAFRADSGSAPGAVAEAIRAGPATVTLLAAPAPDEWFATVAGAAGRSLSGPGRASSGLGLAFLGPEALGDTAIELQYDGGSFLLQDALYDMDERRFLDLLAFEVTEAAAARPIVASLLRYVATDVEASAAVVMAVAVPSPAVGDSVARMLSPGFTDARRCGAAAAEGGGRPGIRLFYGPEARIFCRAAEPEGTGPGAGMRASLVMGRR